MMFIFLNEFGGSMNEWRSGGRSNRREERIKLVSGI
jgi:hypothetical protein